MKFLTKVAKRDKKMLEILAEEKNEKMETVLNAYSEGLILLFENADKLAWFFQSEGVHANMKVYNLFDWGWAVDTRKTSV